MSKNRLWAAARYGEITGKTVALEPSTGFSFDTLAVPRYH